MGWNPGGTRVAKSHIQHLKTYYNNNNTVGMICVVFVYWLTGCSFVCAFACVFGVGRV